MRTETFYSHIGGREEESESEKEEGRQREREGSKDMKGVKEKKNTPKQQSTQFVTCHILCCHPRINGDYPLSSL